MSDIAQLPGMFTLDVTGYNGTPFRVLAISRSFEGPNPNRAPAEREHPTVEFYDRRYPNEFDGEHGQFTGGSYHVDTILGRDNYGSGRGGLNLQGGADAWQVDAAAMEIVRAWLATLADRGQLR